MRRRSSSISSSARRRRRPISSSACSPPPPICWPAWRANRSAPSCAVAALPGRDAGRGFPRRHLQQGARRAARPAPQGAGMGRYRPLHRLQAVRRGLPDRHRYPRRPSARMHRLRPVRRFLQRHHGEGRPAAQPDRLRYRAAHGATLGKATIDLPADPAAHGAVFLHAAGRRRPDGLLARHARRSGRQRAARPDPVRATVERRDPEQLRSQGPEQGADDAQFRPCHRGPEAGGGSSWSDGRPRRQPA